MLTLVSLNAFDDNYIWVLHNDQAAIVVDPGDEAPVSQFLASHSLRLEAILCTHHHNDHTGGIEALRTLHPNCRVIAPSTPRFEKLRTESFLPNIDLLGCTFQVIPVPGHTLDHQAYYAAPWLFCGDTLFAAGCGRLFEGSPEAMWQSLSTLAALPDDTLVCCAHEYTLSNLAFAQHVMPNNPEVAQRVVRESAKRDQGLPTLPSSIALEKQTNPFLRPLDPEIQVAIAPWLVDHPEKDTAAAAFSALRAWKNQF